MQTTSASTIRAGRLGLAGGLVSGVGAALLFATTDQTSGPGALVRGSMSAVAFTLTEPVWALCHLLALLCILGLRRSGLTGDAPAARVGMTLTVAGLAVLVPCELAVACIGGQPETGTAMSVLDPIFGLASVAATIGLLTVGVTTLRAGRWTGWERFTPLVAGLAGLVLSGLAPTSAFLLGIALWKFTLAAVGLAMVRRPAPVTVTAGSAHTATVPGDAASDRRSTAPAAATR